MLHQLQRDVYGAPIETIAVVGDPGPNHAIIQYLDLPVVTTGVRYPRSGAHALNENLFLDFCTIGVQHKPKFKILWSVTIECY